MVLPIYSGLTCQMCGVTYHIMQAAAGKQQGLMLLDTSKGGWSILHSDCDIKRLNAGRTEGRYLWDIFAVPDVVRHGCPLPACNIPYPDLLHVLGQRAPGGMQICVTHSSSMQMHIGGMQFCILHLGSMRVRVMHVGSMHLFSTH